MGEAGRLKAARQVVNLTDRATKIATTQSRFGAMVRNAAMGLIGHNASGTALNSEQKIAPFNSTAGRGGSPRPWTDLGDAI